MPGAGGCEIEKLSWHRDHASPTGCGFHGEAIEKRRDPRLVMIAADLGIDRVRG